MSRYRVKVALTVAGPFLIGATGSDLYGIDRAFHRDYRNAISVPASHWKGRLRATLTEIAVAVPAGAAVDVGVWFGEESAAGAYEPRRARLAFTDLTCRQPDGVRTRNRVAIDHASGTAAERLLRTLEDPYGSSEEVRCEGAISYYADSDDEALTVARWLYAGLCGITALGGQQGVGYGRVLRVRVDLPEVAAENVGQGEIALAPDSTVLHLEIRPEGELLVGGVKHPRSNLTATRTELPGGLIKGALAAALNRAHGRPDHAPLSASVAHEFPGCEALVTHYTAVRVTHGLPAYEGKPRPVRMPASAARVGDETVDTALLTGAPLIRGLAPAYYPDWKNPQEYLDAAAPAMRATTRTGIDPVTQRVADNQLYTYLTMAPVDDEGRDIVWLANAYVDGVPEGERQAVRSQFARAVSEHLHGLGKRNGAVGATVADGPAPQAVSCRGMLDQGLAIVTLQSDAIMLDPCEVRALSPEADLHDLYAAFWREISDGTMALEDFWASQSFQGGYLYHRYLGAMERHTQPNAYRPYYLTCAGSVFRLRVQEERARGLLTGWLAGGLPVPAWACSDYGAEGRALWQTCPFVPENGYGEIAINLSWHWDMQPAGALAGEGS